MNKSLNTFYWLVKREFWEHRGGFFWTPVITAVVIIIIQILGLITTATLAQGNPHLHDLATASPGQLRDFAGFMQISAMIPAGIVALVMFFVLYSYCMKNLASDRRDRSILFWKSLPISDTATVISKAFSAVIMVPVIAYVTGAIASFIMLLALSIAGGLAGGDFAHLFLLSRPGSVMLDTVSALPVYWIWMFPCAAWLMLCSAFSSGKAARWAIALPLVVGVLFTWIGLMQSWTHAVIWGWRHVIGRALLSILPGSSTFLGNTSGLLFAFQSRHDIAGFNHTYHQVVAERYAMVLTPDVLWGALAGFIMIALAIWLRRWRTEL